MSIRLVSSELAYPKEHTRYMLDPEDRSEARSIAQKYNQLVQNLGITDYKVIADHANGYVSLRLRTQEEWNRVTRALNPADICEAFFTYNEDHDFRKIKRDRNNWQKTIDKTELRGNIRIEADRNNKSLAVKASDEFSNQQFRTIINGSAQLTMI